MQKLQMGKCVGCFEFKKKDGSIGVISHFVYDCQEQEGMQRVFTVWDKCKVGELYPFVFSNGVATLVEDF